MSRITFTQPNGKYALWSTVIDDFLLTNATKEELIQFHIDEFIDTIREKVENSIEIYEGYNINTYIQEYAYMHDKEWYEQLKESIYED